MPKNNFSFEKRRKELEKKAKKEEKKQRKLENASGTAMEETDTDDATGEQEPSAPTASAE